MLHHIWQHRTREWPNQEISDGRDLGRLAEDGEHRVTATAHEQLAQALPGHASREDEHVGLGGNPQNGHGENGRDRGGQSDRGNSGRSGGRHPLLQGASRRIARRHMPRHIYGNLRHDLISEAEGGRELRKLFYRVGDDAGFLDASQTVRTGSDVRLEGGNAKTLLVIEEEVDLSGK